MKTQNDGNITDFQLHSLILEMKEIYVRTRVCPYRTIGANCDLNLDHG